MSLHLNALKIYNELIRLHQQEADPSALVVVVLEKLKFIRQYATVKEKETLFLEGLNLLKERYNKYPVSALVDFERATFHYKKGERYQRSREENRFEKAKALESM